MSPMCVQQNTTASFCSCYTPPSAAAHYSSRCASMFPGCRLCGEHDLEAARALHKLQAVVLQVARHVAGDVHII